MTAINGPLADAVGLAVLHLLWQGTLIAIALAIALRLLARSTASVRYTISCAALAGLVLCGVATAYQTYEPQSELALLGSAATTEIESRSTVPEGPGRVAALISSVHMHSSSIAVVWLIGVLTLAARLALSWSRTRQLTRGGLASPPDEWQHVVARLGNALGIRRLVRLVESAAVDVPSVIGLFKPVILVPASSLSGLSPRQLEMILAHELAHIRRHDYLMNMLQSVAETLLFYHPAAWWISRKIRIERENCCDDLAVATCGNAIEYARALAVLEELRSAPMLAVAASGGSLLDRVRRVVGLRERKMVNGWTALAAVVSFAVVMMIMSVPVRAERDEAVAPAPAQSEVEVVAKAPAPPAPPRAVAPAAMPALAPLVELPDIDFDPPDIDIDPPDVPWPAPVAAPAIRAVAPALALAPTPRPALAIAAAPAFDYDDDRQDRAQRDQPLGASGRLTVDELIALRIHNVTPEYISEMRALFGPMTLKSITSLRIMNVTPKYVADMRAAGVKITTAKEAVQLRSFNVTPEFIRSLAAAGYADLTVRDVTRLVAAGVNADFIREMSKYREKK